MGLIISIGGPILILVSLCFVFKKMGEEWWKALIPIYNLYILFTKIWSKKAFIIFMCCMACVTIMLIIFTSMGVYTNLSLESGLIYIAITLIFCGVTAIYFGYEIPFKTAECFGHGGGMGALGLFFPYIFWPIIGFSKNVYTGNAWEQRKAGIFVKGQMQSYNQQQYVQPNTVQNYNQGTQQYSQPIPQQYYPQQFQQLPIYPQEQQFSSSQQPSITQGQPQVQQNSTIPQEQQPQMQQNLNGAQVSQQYNAQYPSQPQ